MSIRIVVSFMGQRKVLDFGYRILIQSHEREEYLSKAVIEMGKE